MNLSVPVTTVTAGHSIANIMILTIEHLLHNNLGHPDSSSSLLMTGAWVTTTSLILATNIPLIYFIVHQRYKTFLDKLIIFDCILCIVGIVIVILNKVIRYTVEDVNFCIKIFLPFLLNLCNRFLTLSIVIYRYVFVLHSSVVETRNQRRAFESLVVSLIIIPSLYFTGVSIYYRDNNFHYLECSGRLQEFYYNTTDFYGEKILFPAAGLRLPLSHPFIVTIITILGSSFVIAPACYAKIYRFQKQQNQSVSGLSEAARNKRKHRNVVAMKFNLINYILETVSMILMLIFKEEVIILLYLLTNSCGTPLVYYLGIEENRKQAEEYFRSNVRIFKRRRVSPIHSNTIMDSPETPSLKLEDLEMEEK